MAHRLTDTFKAVEHPNSRQHMGRVGALLAARFEQVLLS